MTRRAFVAGCGAAVLALGIPAAWIRAADGRTPRRAHPHCRRTTAAARGPHPTPRAGIDASKVLSAQQLRDTPDAQPAFESARRIPAVLDGIRCHCGCAEAEGHYSLLSCFEGEEAMARECVICQAQVRLADRLARGGSSLTEIRAAIDARFE